MKKSLLLTTALVSASFLGFQQQALGACTAVGADVTCTGANTSTQSINIDNADVTVSSGFSVNTSSGNGVTISGAGALSFTDSNTVGSVDIKTTGSSNNGLDIHSTGDDGSTASTITVDTNSDITGDSFGIKVDNDGTGATIVNSNGDVEATHSRGVGIEVDTVARNADSTINVAGGVEGDVGVYLYQRSYSATEGSGTLSLIMQESAHIDASRTGIVAFSMAGNLAYAQIDGTIESGAVGVLIFPAYGDATVVTGANSLIDSDSSALMVYNIANGDIDVTHNGAIEAGSSGMFVYAGTDSESIKILTNQDSQITSGEVGVEVVNTGQNATTDVTINGDITAQSHALYTLVSDLSADTNLVIGTSSSLTSTNGRGIFLNHHNSDAASITVNGDITASNQAIYVEGFTTSTDLTVNVGQDAKLKTTGDFDAIYINHKGTNGTTDLTISGDVVSQGGHAINISQANSNSAIAMTINNGATVRSDTKTAIITDSGKILDLKLNDATIIGKGGTAIDFGDENDILDITGGTVSFTGDVDGGAGTDILNIRTATLDIPSDSRFLNFENVNFTGFVTIPATRTINIQSSSAVSISEDVIIQVIDSTTFGKIIASNGFAFSNNANIQVDASNIGNVADGTTLSNVLSGGPITGIASGTLNDNSSAYNFSSVINGDNLDILVEKIVVPVTTPNTPARNLFTNTPGDISPLVNILDASATNSQIQSVVNNLNGLSTSTQRAAAVRTLLPKMHRAKFNTSKSVGKESLNAAQGRLNKLRNTGSSGVSTGDKPQNKAIWGGAFGKEISQGFANGDLGYDAKVSGLIVGADFELNESTIIGASVSHQVSWAQSRSDTSDSNSVSQNLVLYGSHDFDNNVFAQLYLLGGISDIKGERRLFDGTYSLADYNGKQFATKGTIGYNLQPFNGLYVTPFVSTQYHYIWHDAYTEVGGSLPLSVGATSFRSIESEIGTKLAYPFTYRDVKYIPSASVGWERDLTSDDVISNVSFATTAGSSFTSTTQAGNTNQFNFATGLEVLTSDNVIVSFDYGLEVQKKYLSHSGMVNIKYKF